jgi:DNA replication protein DnaC
MDDALIESLKYLKLPGLLANWKGYLEFGAEKRLSHGALLAHIVEAECRLRRENARQLRIKRAQIKEMLVMETFPFDQQPNLDKERILAVYDDPAYLAEGRNILWLGGTGVGKSGLATSFLVDAINRGYTGRFVTFPVLALELFQSMADHSENEVIDRYVEYDVLLIDEVGYVNMEPAQAGYFFMLLQMRHRKKPTLITSNHGFADWPAFLRSDHLAAALIDRLTEMSHVFNMKDCVTIREKLKE